MVSANGDEKIGEIISEVMSKIGDDGTVKVENGNGVDMSYEIVEGMTVDRSYASPYMVTNPETMEAELDDPWVLVVDRKLSSFKEMLPSLQQVSNTGKPLFIIAESYADEVLATLIMNKMRGGLNSVVIESPSYGDNRAAILEDIATLCGGRVVSDKTGTKLENAVAATGILGQAKRVVVNKNSTIIIGGMGDKEKIAERVRSIKAQIEKADEFDAQHLRERLAKLTSGIGVISVGATTEAERKELRDRVDDAFAASKAAVKGGVVAGGGTALLQARRGVREWIETADLTEDEKVGAKILADSFEAPARRIIDNSGADSATIVGKLGESEPGLGYDVLTGGYVDMVEAGIIDPTDVVVNEIQNAASIGGLLLTTEVLVCDKPEERCKNCDDGNQC